MVDIASIEVPRTRQNESHDGAILLLAAAGILAVFLAIAIMHPSGIGHGAEYVPTMFGF